MSKISSLTNFITGETTKVSESSYLSYNRPLEEQYLQCLLTNTMGGTYYTKKEKDMESAINLHKIMIAKDPGFAAAAIAFAREKGYMRLQPILGLAHLATMAPQFLGKVYHKTILIPDDLFEFKSILNAMGRGEGGRAIKREDSKFLNNLSEYWAIKYNGRGRGYNLTDVIRTSHPQPIDEKHQAIFSYLVGREFDHSEVPQISAYIALQNSKNEDDIVSLIGDGKLPYEVVTGSVEHMSEKVWNALVPQMPKLALLRHLNALDRAGVLDTNRKIIQEKLLSKGGKILPFQYLKAFEKVDSGWLKDTLREAIENSFDAIPDLHGRTAIFLDISGSMDRDFVKIAAIFSIGLYKKTKGDSIFLCFDNRCLDPKVSRHDSILTQADRVVKLVGGCTDTGICLQHIMRKGENVDNVICITDEQQNSGSPFYAVLREYRRRINRDTKAFIVDVANYSGASIPESDTNTYYTYGWSDNVLKYIPLVTQGFGGMVEDVRKNWM